MAHKKSTWIPKMLQKVPLNFRKAIADGRVLAVSESIPATALFYARGAASGAAAATGGIAPRREGKNGESRRAIDLAREQRDCFPLFSCFWAGSIAGGAGVNCDLLTLSQNYV
jgi:hypothetical protein